MAELRTAANRAGIADRVRFLGQRADVPRLMAAADVFCQPNIGPEPFGIVFVEALYAGLPVVTSGFGGATEIVDKTCGVLTTPGDAEALAAALRSLIQDPSRRQTLGAAGPGRARSLCDPARQLNAAAALCNRRRWAWKDSLDSLRYEAGGPDSWPLMMDRPDETLATRCRDPRPAEPGNQW